MKNTIHELSRALSEQGVAILKSRIISHISGLLHWPEIKLLRNDARGLSIYIGLMLVLTILYDTNVAQAKECPGDMVLWRGPNSTYSDCVCPPGQQMVTNITSGTLYRFGRCQETYNLNLVQNTPKNIAPNNLILWLDGDDPYGTGMRPPNNTAMSTWYDKSGYNNHAYGNNSYGNTGSPIFRNTTGSNIRYTPGMYFNGSTCLQINNASGTNNFVNAFNYGVTMFAVIYPNGATNGVGSIFYKSCYSGCSGSGNAFGIVQIGAGPQFDADMPGGFIYTNYSLNSWYIVGGLSQSSPWNSGYSFVNTTKIGPIVTNSYSISNPWFGSVGSKAQCQEFWDGFQGYIAELVVYNTGLSLSQVQALQNYLNQKWAVYW